ncbi:FAD binding domain-containing protein [Streptomyces fuscigenes]|uniref:FAD binding domain-containing protein n=1 Tax=Streptomyces fuscigenes TaxID=1528880 RepID=UPI001F2D3E5A|nr:FAD binding domain-containing protein [Streptomyces fuscigenes]MCF3960703.1 FAD binding domain-containing protein [Streptomyces fuscigenes]
MTTLAAEAGSGGGAPAPRPPVALAVPRSLDEALALLAQDGAAVLGGGVGHTLARHHRAPDRPSTLVPVAGLPALAGVRTGPDGRITVGAATPLDDCAKAAAIARVWPVFTEACGSVATGRIRRLVTLGGNIAAHDDAHDPPVALTALGADLTVRAARGGSRTLSVPEALRPAADGGLRPGELLVAVTLPTRPRGAATGSAYRKYLVRGVWEYACVHVAAVVGLDGEGRATRLSLAVGSVEGGPVAVPLDGLLGGRFDADLVEEAARAAASGTRPYDDVKGSAAYKTRMIGEFSRRALTEAAHRARGTGHHAGGDR